MIVSWHAIALLCLFDWERILGTLRLDKSRVFFKYLLSTPYLSTLMAARLRIEAVQQRTSNATHASQRASPRLHTESFTCEKWQQQPMETDLETNQVEKDKHAGELTDKNLSSESLVIFEYWILPSYLLTRMPVWNWNLKLVKLPICPLEI